MSYVLYGSKTSPFVRRIRLLMEDIQYDFKEMKNIFEEKDAKELNKINPINQIPVLIDNENVVWDSRIIFNYLNSLHRFQNMDWNDENILTAIDGAMNAGVSLLLMQRSGLKANDDFMYANRQRERIESILDYLKPFIEKEAIERWNFHSISLYCFLDWALFRSLINIDKRPECQKLLKHYESKPIVIDTAIPKV